MSGIPEFAEAVEEFESYLRRAGMGKRLVWAFRDDLWQCGRTRVLLRWPEPNHTRKLIEKVFDEGRAKGLVEIVAVAQAADWIVATVWSRRNNRHRPWTRAFALAMNTENANASL